MSIRALDVDGNWVFGIGQSAYLTGNAEIAESIQTRLKSFVGDCFFDLGAFVNWTIFLGGKNQIGLNIAVSTVILNAPNVVGIRQLTVNLNDTTRVFSISYDVQTVYSILTGAFQYDLGGSA